MKAPARFPDINEKVPSVRDHSSLVTSADFENHKATKMMTVSLLLVNLMLLVEQPAVSAEQFQRLIQARHENVKDFSLTYEGETRWKGPPRILDQTADQFGNRFQGFDFYRNRDAAELTEIYSSNFTVPSTVFIRKKSHLKGKSELLSLSPDQKKVNLGVGIVTGNGSPGGLSGPDSPHPLIYYWYFASMVDPAEKGYQFDGWEEVDGHRCLRVQFNTGRGRKVSDQNFRRYWIDMERGGHPLRVEFYHNGKLSSRTDRIQLSEVSQDGGSPVWFPIVGVLEGFEWEDSFYSSPVLREDIAVVHASVRINQGLDDAVFKIADVGRPSPPAVARQERAGASLALPDKFAKTDPAPVPRTDPASVRTRLQKQLAEAEAQAKDLQGPLVARSSAWSGLVLAQTMLGVAGLILLGTGFWWWRRA